MSRFETPRCKQFGDHGDQTIHGALGLKDRIDQARFQGTCFLHRAGHDTDTGGRTDQHQAIVPDTAGLITAADTLGDAGRHQTEAVR